MNDNIPSEIPPAEPIRAAYTIGSYSVVKMPSGGFEVRAHAGDLGFALPTGTTKRDAWFAIFGRQAARYL